MYNNKENLISSGIDILLSVGFPLESKTDKAKVKLSMVLLAIAGVSDSFEQAKNIDEGWFLTSKKAIRFINDNFNQSIEPGSYDSIRNSYLVPLVAFGILKTSRTGNVPKNSSTSGYTLTPGFKELMRSYNTDEWHNSLLRFEQEIKPDNIKEELTLDNNAIEQDIWNENIRIEIPFDPNDISINIVPRTIGQLVEMLEYHEILIPKYQRLPNLWDIKKKSRFIESLMLNLPIPLFYFDEGEDKKWRVIDGLQRVSTLEHFILAGRIGEDSISGNSEGFKLQDLEFRTEFNGKAWKDLPKDVQRRISTNQVTINLIGKGTPEQVKYNIFSRINQGGIELEAQEIRTALFQGYRVEFLEQLVSSQTEGGRLFLKVTDNSIPTKRQQDLDFATRFITFYLLDYKTYEPDMDSFLTKGTKEIPKDSKAQEEIKTAFKNSMQLSYNIFGTDAFRKRLNVNDKRKPINKPLFEIISVFFSKLDKNEVAKLLSKQNDFLKHFRELQKNDKFWASITTGTAAKERVKQRHEDFENLIKQFI